MSDYFELPIGYVDGKPVNTNPENMSNGHIAMIGSSGGGKSVEAQRIMSSIAQKGGTVLVLSEHGSLAEDQIFPHYKPVIDKYRNDIYAYDKGIPAKLFDPLMFPDGTVETEADTIGSVTDIISQALKLGTRQREVLRLAVEEVMKNDSYKTDGFKSIGKVLGNGNGTKGTNDLYDKMRFLFSHNIFINEGELLKENAINIVHLEKMDLTSQEVTRELLLSFIWRLGNADQFKNKGIYLFIDECQNASAGSKGALALLISEGRRMGINLILATQMVLQGTTNSVQQRISQCALMLFFKPAANRVSTTAKMIAQANESKWMIKLRQLKKGQFIAIGDFLWGGKAVDYPLIVTADIAEIAEYDRKYGFF